MHNDTSKLNANSTEAPAILPARLKVLHIISGDLWAGAEVQAFTLLCSLKATCDLCVAIMNAGELEQRLREQGIRVALLNETESSPLQILRGIITLVKSFAPDIIHTHRQKENILGTLANIFSQLPRFSRIPSLRTVHGAPEHNAKGLKKLIIKLDQACGNYGQDAIISVSNDLTCKLQGQFKTEQIHTIHNGIDVLKLQQTNPAADIRTSSEPTIHIGIVGRLEPVKRIDLFLQAAAYLCAHPNLPTLKFHVIGDGKLKSHLQILANDLGLTEKVRFHGHRSDSQAAIAALDIVMMCSDHEGTPMTALETLALGKPLVAHKVGGLAEILANEPNLLVSDHSAQGYGDCIINALNHPRRPALPNQYNANHNAKMTFQLYENISKK